jgi:hypothetical protein
MLGNVAVVKVGDPQVEDNIEQKGEIQDNKIEAILPNPYTSLHGQINPKNPDGLYEKI